MNYSTSFEIDETKEEARIEPLVNEPYNFENIVNNPIIKPISETDRGVRDLEEIKIKKLIELNAEKKKINEALLETPEYNEITFVGTLLNMVSMISDVMKMQDLQMKKYVECIREINTLIRQNYQIEDSNGQKNNILNVDYSAYLNKLLSNEDKIIVEVCNLILKEFKINNNPDMIKRYEDSCMKIYKEVEDKTKKQKIAKIMRMEL